MIFNKIPDIEDGLPKNVLISCDHSWEIAHNIEIIGNHITMQAIKVIVALADYS